MFNGAFWAGHVHKGFARAVEDFLPFGGQVDSTKPLWITGHSLGGAMALLAAARLSVLGFELMPVYTFGCPRVGNAAFGACASQRMTHYRVVHDDDIVPHLPPDSLGYGKNP